MAVAVSALLLGTTAAMAEVTYHFRAPAFDTLPEEVVGLAILTPPLAAFHVGSEGVARLAVNGATGSIHWTVTDVPPGLTFRDGQLTGVATDPGAYDIHVRLVDDFHNVAERVWTVQVLDSLTLLYPGDVTPPIGKAYASPAPRILGGAVAPVRYSVVGGGLPNGLRLDPATGVVRGRADSLGAFTISVKAVDAIGGAAVSAPFDVRVGDVRETSADRGLALTIAFPTSLKARVGVPLRGRRPEVTGSFTEPLDWSLVEPIPGLGMDAKGRFVGAPTESGSFTSEIQLEDATGVRAYSASFDIEVLEPLSSGPMPDRSVTMGRPVVIQPFSVSGGPQAPLTWSVGLLPDGLVIDSRTGVVSGTPIQTGSYVVTVAATDAAGAGVTGSFALDVGEGRASAQARASN